MARKTALVTGSSGLIGSEAVSFLDERGWAVPRVEHHDVDVRDRTSMLRLVDELKPDLVIHAAAQPSHDLAASRPFDDFDVNAVGTLNLLEAARRSCPEAPFAFLSTN